MVSKYHPFIFYLFSIYFFINLNVLLILLQQNVENMEFYVGLHVVIWTDKSHKPELTIDWFTYWLRFKSNQWLL